MVSKGLEMAMRALMVASAAVLIQSAGVNADDTEIYKATPQAVGARPQVLIVFDDSLSMNDLVTEPPVYDPDASYVSFHPADRVYWSTGGVPVKGSNDFFYANTNRCAESIDPLAEDGFYPTIARRWFPGGNDQFCQVIGGVLSCLGGDVKSAGWLEITSGSITAPHFDCKADVDSNNAGNPGIPDGFPQNSSTDGEEYGPGIDPSLDWSTTGVTFYSAHYMDWYYDDTLVLDTTTKLEVAQTVVSNLVAATTAVDFGLVLFNDNENPLREDDTDGGRVVQRLIPDMDDDTGDDHRANLTGLLADTIPEGFTPLCETTMEVYRYLAGLGVVYGNSRNPVNDPTPKDALAEDPPGTYAPPTGECSKVSIILMTDGRPTYDTDANDEIEALTGKICESYPNGFQDGNLEKNCLPELAEYMAYNDIDDDASNGVQTAQFYAVGYQLEADEPFLSETASRGLGEYYPAEDAASLAAAFQQAILAILSDVTTFTSPGVAVDTFTRTESRDEVFFAMFQPDNGVNWPGNIKRLDIDIDPQSGAAVLVDEDGDPAIDAASGQIKATATTFWSREPEDGPEVTSGGVGAILKARGVANRILYSNTGNNDALQLFAAENMTPAAFGFNNNAALFDFFGVDNEAQFALALLWGAGFDTQNEDGDAATDTRWMLGDMLHSKPLVVNYGARTNAFTSTEPDLRIVAGTNSGFLHMFGNVDGIEDWAFFPKELAAVLHKRRLNESSATHVYGIDAPAVLYINDINKDGNLITSGNAAESDQVYLYFGLRRGGRILYALDISDPDNPAFLWRIDNSTPGFSELGQTWSVPVLTRIPGWKDNDGRSKPVLVFGAGYDTNKDSPGLATPDAIGRGLFIVDAASGELVWSMTPAPDSDNNMSEPGLRHSVAAAVTVLDSNGDELSDRIYFADTGGQLWRVDLPGSDLPDANQDTWRVVRLATVNDGTAATDRRFFNAPDVVRTSYADATFDAVLIGSGDRTNPNDPFDGDDPNDPGSEAVDNQFYMFRDRAINPYFTEAPSLADCNADPPSADFRCELPLTPADLYDATDDIFLDGTAEEQAAAVLDLVGSSGWLLGLENEGEKALARSITIEGKVYFTTFEPASTAVNLCAPLGGTGRLYVVDLINAAAQEDFDSNGNTDRSWIIGSILPDTPSPHFGSDGEIRLLLPPGSDGSGALGSPFLTGASIPKPFGTYWFQEEY